MSRNGAGTYSRVAGVPYVYNTVIDEVVVNAEMDDIATALTASLSKDGQTTPTANLPMGGFRHTTVGAATARTQYARAAEAQDNALAYLSSVAGTNTITASAPLSMAAYAVGQEFDFTPAATNTAAATLNINSIGAGAVQLNGAALAGGELRSGVPVSVRVTATTPVFEIVANGAFLPKSGGSLTGGINEARGSVVMHATTMDLWAQPNVIDGTGSAVTVTAIANAPQAGARRVLYPIAGSIITNGATFAVDGAANATAATGDKWEFEAITTSTYKVHVTKADGTPVVSSGGAQIQPISASVGSNALTISASALSLQFRSATLGSGTVTTVSGTPSNLVISSGSTLGTTSGGASRIAVLALNNAGTIELAAVNTIGSVDLTESGLISTTAEGGAGAADSASVAYSTTARTNVAYRVIGYVDSTQATAGTWATAPSLIQGAGGEATKHVSKIMLGTSVSASGTSVDFTGIPVWAKRITLTMNGLSTSGSSYPIVQLGDPGGIEATGYEGACSTIFNSATPSGNNHNTGFIFQNGGSAAYVLHGSLTLSLHSTSNRWTISGSIAATNAATTFVVGGHKILSSVLDRIRVTTEGGADTFDAGTLNILYE